jgi:KaiC/GvpD/RAD55 family RecA-like ATPase
MVDKNPIVYDIMLPDFIPKIMDLPHGYALLIKGDAGTGKSTFAMEICLQNLDRASMVFISTRTNLEDLATQYATFTQQIGKGNVKDLAAVGMSDDNLKMLNVDADSFLNLFFDFEKILKDLAAKNEPAGNEASPSRKSIVIIDSIEKMIESIRKKKAATTDTMVYETLVEYARKYSFKLFIVAETAQKSANDYLVDGIVTLYRDIETIPDRLVRTMTVQKLRNMSIEQQVIVFTLYQGRFRTIPQLKPRVTIMPIDQQVHAIHGLMVKNQLSQMFFINLFTAKHIYLEIDATANSVLMLWNVIFTVVALLNKIPVLFIATGELNVDRFVKALTTDFGEEHVRKYFKLGFVTQSRSTPDWTPDYIISSQSGDFLDELRGTMPTLELLRKTSSNKGVLVILPLDSIFLKYKHDTLPNLVENLSREKIFGDNDVILWTSLSLREPNPLYTRFVENISSRIMFAMRGIQVSKTQILYWMKMPRPAYGLVPKFIDKPFTLERLDIIPLM